MLRVDQLNDLDTAKQVAILLEAENKKLHTKLKKLAAENAALRGEEGAKQLELELLRLQERMQVMNRALFGRKTERRHSEEKGREEKKPQTGHGRRPQPALPVVEVVHELEAPDRQCSVCDGTVDEWAGQFEESEIITVIERKFILEKHKRQKYRCKCNANVVVTPPPTKLMSGGRYSLEFAISVAIAKYDDHLPLNREARRMSRAGLDIDSQTLWDQINALARLLEPCWHAVANHIMANSVIHADETPWYMLVGKPSQRWYMWCISSQDASYYWIHPSRSTQAAREVLGDYQGTILVDGYKAYGTLARGSPGISLAFCWSHVRRKFIEAELAYPHAAEALDLIDDLFDVESLVPDHLVVANPAPGLELRQKLRDTKSRPLLDQIEAWLGSQAALPQDLVGKAIKYTMRLWPGLVRFLDDPRIPIHNNLVERQLRGPVVGRKNHYGSKSRRGTQVAALFYSLVSTCQLAGVDPTSYLREAATSAQKSPGAIILPHELA